VRKEKEKALMPSLRDSGHYVKEKSAGKVQESRKGLQGQR
jgi:hypothetical protein